MIIIKLIDKLSVLKNKLIKYKNNNINDNQIKENLRPDIIDVKFLDDMILIDIKNECQFFEYSDTIDKFYNRLNQTFIPIKILITSGGNIKDWIIYKQKIYIFKDNNYDYMISVSDNKIKISQTILKEELYYETELDYKVNEKDFTIYKLVHDMNRSTKCPKWYPEEENSPFYLDEEEAYNLLKELFNGLDLIRDINNMILNLESIKSNVFKEFGDTKKLEK